MLEVVPRPSGSYQVERLLHSSNLFVEAEVLSNLKSSAVGELFWGSQDEDYNPKSGCYPSMVFGFLGGGTKVESSIGIRS